MIIFYTYRSIIRKASIYLGITSFLLYTVALSGPAAARYASIIVNAENGQTLLATNADTRNYPASLTKMMTLFLMFDALENGKWTLDSKLNVSARAARQPASRLGLKRGDSITVKNAILALITKSANDVATVVAENLAGTERKFALKMTAMARKLNMSRTTFRNASGLPHRGQLSTARDMATLARALLLRHQKYYYFFSTKSFRYGQRTYKNHNKLLAKYKGVDGIKTGYIRASGYNLVASVQRANKRLVGVIFGGRNSRHRNLMMTKLLDKGFKKINRSLRTVSISNSSSKLQKPSLNNRRTKKIRPRRTWGVQVGAYRTYSQAYVSAKSAIKIAKSQLTGGTVAIVPLKTRRGKLLYRARIKGLTSKKAHRACKILEKKSRDCMKFLVKNFQLAFNEH